MTYTHLDREPIVCCPTGVINVQNQGTETRIVIVEKISQISAYITI